MYIRWHTDSCGLPPAGPTHNSIQLSRKVIIHSSAHYLAETINYSLPQSTNTVNTPPPSPHNGKSALAEDSPDLLTHIYTHMIQNPQIGQLTVSCCHDNRDNFGVPLFVAMEIYAFDWQAGLVSLALHCLLANFYNKASQLNPLVC